MGGTLGGFLLIRGGTVLRGGAGTGGKRFFLIFFFSLDTKISSIYYKTRKQSKSEGHRHKIFFFRLFNLGLFSFGFFWMFWVFFIRRSIDLDLEGIVWRDGESKVASKVASIKQR